MYKSFEQFQKPQLGTIIRDYITTHYVGADHNPLWNPYQPVFHAMTEGFVLNTAHVANRYIVYGESDRYINAYLNDCPLVIQHSYYGQ